MTTDEKKIKDLINSSREDQVIGINLMVYTMRWSIEDCALFYFLNTKPESFWAFKKVDNKVLFTAWTQSFHKVGNYDIRFSRKIKEEHTSPLDAPDEECTYRCVLSPNSDKLPQNVTLQSNDILHEFYPMTGNPPVIKFFSEAIKLNLKK